MQIRPSIIGFYAKHYAVAVVLAVLLMIGAAFAPALTNAPALSVVLFFSGAGIIALTILHTFLYRQTTALSLANEEITFERGILGHEMINAPVHMVTDMIITRSFFDKLIGIATLGINTSGSTAMEIIAADFGYSDVKMMHEEINRLIRSTPTSLPDDKRVEPDRK